MLKNINESDYRQLIDALFLRHDATALTILLIVLTGARSNEIIKITHKSMNIIESNGVETATIHVIASKRGVSRWIPMPSKLLRAFKDLRARLRAEKKDIARLINESSMNHRTAYKVLRIYFNNLQLELFGDIKYSIHSARHSLAFRAFAANNNIMQVKTMLGHRDVSATARYLTEYESVSVLNNIQNLVMGNICQK